MFQIQGSGNIIARELAVSSFLRLHLNNPGYTEIIQSDEEKVIIECDDNLQEFLRIENTGRTLYVYENSGLRRAVFTKLHIKVYVRQIDTLICNCRGETVCANAIVCKDTFSLESNSEGNASFNLEVGALKAVFRCEGNVTLRGHAAEANIRTMCEGDFFARDFIVGKLKFKGISEGNTELYSTESISINHISEGYVHYYGPGILKDIRHMGEGMVKHCE